MKPLICCLFALMAVTTTHAQIAYYDATSIKTLCGPLVPNADSGVISLPANIQPSVYAILANYVRNDQKTQGGIQSAFATNPFFHITILKKVDLVPPAPTPVDASTLTSSPLSGVGVTNIVNGIAQFMIQRAKEELTISFFNQLEKFADQHVEFKILFPKTLDVLDRLITFQYPMMISNLRSAFFADLSNLPSNLQGLLALPKYQAFFAKYPEVSIAVKTLKLTQDISSGKAQPADAINTFANFSEWSSPGLPKDIQNFASAVKLGSIFSQSLRNVDSISHNTASWIPASDFIHQAEDPIFLQLYLGLLYQKIVSANIEFNDKPFSSSLTNSAGAFTILQTQLSQFLQLGQEVDSLTKAIAQKKASANGPTSDDYYNYISTAINVVESSFDIARYFDEKLDDIHQYTQLARDGAEIYRNVADKQYPQAITSAFGFMTGLTGIITGDKAADQTIMTEIKAVINTPNTASTITAASLDKLDKKEWSAIKSAVAGGHLTIAQRNSLLAAQQYQTFTNLNKILSTLQTYGMFMANLATATSADEVESVVENAVLPVGSSSIKKYSAFNLSVQSYIGLRVNFNNPPATLSSAWTDRLGVTAPIGIAGSWGLKKWGSLSLFVPLFDIGAIVDYQLKADSAVTNAGVNTSVVKKTYQVNLGQIVSPGAYIVYGSLGNLPISVGIGAQYGPGLGKVSSDGTTLTVNSPSWRYSAFLAIDIPFFNIINTKYKSK